MERKILKLIAQTSGLDYHEVKTKVKEVQQAYGIPAELYLSDECWRRKETWLKNISYDARLKIAKDAQEQCNLPLEGLEENVLHCKILGVPISKYVKYQCWELNDIELTELAKQIKINNQMLQEHRAFIINSVTERTGESFEQTKKKMVAAKKEGYSFLRYLSMGLFRLPKDQWPDLDHLSKVHAAPKAKDSEAEIKRVMDKMGWNRAQYALNYLAVNNRCGCSEEEYMSWKLYEKTEEQLDSYITFRHHVRMQYRFVDYGGDFTIFEDKCKFNTVFAEYIHRKWIATKNISYEDFLSTIDGLDRVIFKPENGICGRNISVYTVNESEEQNKKVYKAVTSQGEGILEEVLQQHHELAAINSSSLNTIRVMALVWHGECRVLGAAIRIGRSGAVVDNFHADGICAGINVESGIVETNAADLQGNLYEKHPDSGVVLKGLQIPLWNEVLETIKSASQVVPSSPYVGWDVAILEDKVAFIEGNHNQMGTLVQYPYVIELGKGKLDTIAPYLDFNNKRF